MITVPVPAGVVIPEGAVQVPNSFLIWRDGLVIVAILPTGQVITSDPFPDEIVAEIHFCHYAYMH